MSIIAEKVNKKELIEGGLADHKTLQYLAKRHNVDMKELRNQLKKGMTVEMEHTNKKSIAKEIAMDHLFEDPNYYNKLAKIEKQ